MAVFGWALRFVVNAFALAGGGLVIVTQHDPRLTVAWIAIFAMIVTQANNEIGRDE